MGPIASSRRDLASPRADAGHGEEPGSAAVVALVGGKGGVGTSLLASLFACALSRAGRRVLLFDAAMPKGDLATLFAVRGPARPDPILAGTTDPAEWLLMIGERLALLPAPADEEALLHLTPTDRARLHLRLSVLFERFEIVIVDGGTGIEATTRACIGSGRLVVIGVPEPTALRDAYAVVKVAALHTPQLPVSVLVNRVGQPDEGPASSAKLQLAASRFLGREVEALGAIAEQEALRRAARDPAVLRSLELPEITDLAARMAELAAPVSTEGSRTW
jgi:flagellar biosynthesis protein FlhG